MRRRFIKNMATVIAVSVAVSTCGVTAFADSTEDVTTEVVAKNGEDEKYNSVKVEKEKGGATAVSAQSSGDENKASVSVNADVSAEAGSYVKGVQASSEKSSTTTVEVGGNVSADEGFNDKGVVADSKESSTTTVEVGGNVSADSKVTKEDSVNSGTTIGVHAGSGTSSTTTVKVGGDVSADNKVTKEDASYSLSAGAVGVEASSNSSTTTVEVGRNVSAVAEADNTSGYAYAYAYGVKVESRDSSTTTVGVEGNVSAKSTASASADARGIDVFSLNSKTDITAGDVKAEGKTAKGISFTNNDNASTIINVDSVTAIASGDESSGVFSYGINGTLNAGNVNIDVSGDVTSKSSKNQGSNENSGPSAFIPKAYASGIQAYGNDGTLTIGVGGNVIQEGEQGFGISVVDTSPEPNESNQNPDPVITVTVAKDVKAEDTAISINKSLKNSKMDVTVGGTVSGGEHAIVIGEDTKTDNLNITVWKVDTTDKQNIVETQTGYDYESSKPIYEATETTKQVEQNINYIISVQSDVKVSAGTRKVNGYDTAHQDETVTLAVTVPSGFEIENFYNVSPGNIISLTKGSTEGTYLLVVPRGGGVDVGVSLKKTTSENPVNLVTPDNPVTHSYYESSDSDSNDSSSWSPDSQNTNLTYYSWSTQDTSAIAAAVASLQMIHAANFAGSENVANVGDVLTPVDTLTAINNFTASGAGNPGTENVMGAGVVSFNNVFASSVSDTVDVPVVATVTSGMTYTVMFSDGTSLTVPCYMDGLLTIPFNKNAEGLTYIIYGLQIDPTMMFAGETNLLQNALAGLTP